MICNAALPVRHPEPCPLLPDLRKIRALAPRIPIIPHIKTTDKEHTINMIKVLTTENFKETVNSEQKTLVDFWAPWCGPCRMLSPIIDEIAENATDFQVGKVNVDEQQNIAIEYQIAAIPTLLVFKNGEVIAKSLGLLSKEEVLALLETK